MQIILETKLQGNKTREDSASRQALTLFRAIRTRRRMKNSTI